MARRYRVVRGPKTFGGFLGRVIVADDPAYVGRLMVVPGTSTKRHARRRKRSGWLDRNLFGLTTRWGGGVRRVGRWF